MVHGDHLGRTLGFPTANLDINGLILPPNGVYAAHVRAQRNDYRSVINIGFRPTVSNATIKPRVEAHLLNFTGDLYGLEIEVFFVEKLREELKFASVEALRSQIEQDVAAATRLFQ